MLVFAILLKNLGPPPPRPIIIIITNASPIGGGVSGVKLAVMALTKTTKAVRKDTDNGTTASRYINRDANRGVQDGKGWNTSNNQSRYMREKQVKNQ